MKSFIPLLLVATAAHLGAVYGQVATPTIPSLPAGALTDPAKAAAFADAVCDSNPSMPPSITNIGCGKNNSQAAVKRYCTSTKVNATVVCMNIKNTTESVQVYVNLQASANCRKTLEAGCQAGQAKDAVSQIAQLAVCATQTVPGTVGDVSKVVDNVGPLNYTTPAALILVAVTVNKTLNLLCKVNSTTVYRVLGILPIVLTASSCGLSNTLGSTANTAAGAILIILAVVFLLISVVAPITAATGTLSSVMNAAPGSSTLLKGVADLGTADPVGSIVQQIPDLLSPITKVTLGVTASCGKGGVTSVLLKPLNTASQAIGNAISNGTTSPDTLNMLSSAVTGVTTPVNGLLKTTQGLTKLTDSLLSGKGALANATSTVTGGLGGLPLIGG